jgi:lysyl-tRNA synthetase class 2
LSQISNQYDSQFEENLYRLRRDKLAQIAAIVRAANPALTDSEAKYPNTFPFTTTVPELRALGEHLSAEDLADMHLEAAIAGRLMAIRVQGKAGFAQIQQNGQRIQIYVRKDDVGEDLFALYKLLDLGDHIGVRGYLMRTRTGELTLHAAPITLHAETASSAPESLAVRAAPPESLAVRVAPPLTFLSKAMLALPDKFHGLEDIELRYRRRYLDLFTDTGDTAETPNPVAPTDSAQAQHPAQNSVILSEATERSAGAQSKDPHDSSPPPTLSAADPAPTTAHDSKGHGFSRAIPDPKETGALAPEAPTQTRQPAREIFVKRAAILRSIRNFFDTRGYLEVETPMLHTVAGGAAARPFTTHHNALDIPLSLRIAPELYLKRLVVGGLDRVYEINRNFRNEGVSTSHNPEFTMLEFYQAYANYHDLMDLTQDLITTVAKDVNGTTITKFGEHEIDLSNWTKLSMREAIREFAKQELGIEADSNAFDSIQNFLAFLEIAAGIAKQWRHTNPESFKTQIGRDDSRRKRQIHNGIAGLEELPGIHKRLITSGTFGKAIAETFELLAEPHLIQPTIIYDFPLAVSPLSKVKPDEPDWVERFEFYIGGFEVGNAFSELNDPVDQRNRFAAQVADKDPESMAEIDEDYVRALGYGLPPTAGEGIGIDRLTMILTGSRSIRDVILFPLMRPQKPTPDPAADPASHVESA